MTERKSQHQLVLEYLQEHGAMTSLEAQRLYGIMQMPRRIFNLRNLGYDIESVPCRGKNSRGEDVNFTTYYLHSNPERRE